jgi:hypothetical protein
MIFLVTVREETIREYEGKEGDEFRGSPSTEDGLELGG